MKQGFPVKVRKVLVNVKRGPMYDPKTGSMAYQFECEYPSPLTSSKSMFFRFTHYKGRYGRENFYKP